MSNTTADIVGEDPRITHLERTKADTERELSRVVDELAHVREMGAAELNAASDALASAAADVDALRAELARQTGIAVDHCARADAAEQMVAELRAAAEAVQMAYIACARAPNTPLGMLDAALSRTEAVAGRWVSKDEADRHVAAALDALQRTLAERDAAIAARDEAVAILDAERKHSAEELDEVRAERDAAIVERNDAIRARDEVGIQLAAAQAEIARMRAVVEAARFQRASGKFVCAALEMALRALDAVPGDALAPVVPPSPAGASAPASGSTPAASSATSSSSEAAGNPSAPSGTCDASVRALIDAARAVDRCYDTGSSIRSSMYRLREALDGLRITAALEASGIDSDNVKGVE